jgi:hypothetical protein
VKSITYAWNDTKACPTCIPGDGLYQPGEEGTQIASSLAGSVSVNPNLKQPYSNQATLFVEQQVTEGVAAHVGFVYFQVKNQTGVMQALRPASAYSVSFPFVDPGPDGRVGTADDVNLTFHGVPNALTSGCGPTVTSPTPTCQYPTNQVVVNAPNNGTYKTVEFALNKRQSHNYSANVGFGYTWQHDFPGYNLNPGYPGTPNSPADYDYTFYSLKATGAYNFPWGILASLAYRFQAGQNYARQLSVTAPASCQCAFSAGIQGTSTTLTNLRVFATPYNAYRQDNISVLDLRVEKTVPLGATRIRLFGDIYNLTNQYAAETINVLTGLSSGVPTFQTPTAILGPRTARVGFRFIW